MAATAGIVTIGDELLAGDIENTNATWLAGRLTLTREGHEYVLELVGRAAGSEQTVSAHHPP